MVSPSPPTDPTWCETHQWPTTGRSCGRRCALSQNDCVTVVKAGVWKRWVGPPRSEWVDVVEL